MKRERSPSFPTLPCLNSARSVTICRPRQDHVMVHKRLRGRNVSSLSKSGVAGCNGYGAANYSTNFSSRSNIAVCQQTPITPTSATASPPATLMQFADFFVDPSAVSPAEAVSLAEEMAADFYSEVLIMYDMLSDIKTPTAEGRAVDELMRRLHSVLNASDTGCAGSSGNLSTRIANVHGLYNGLIRVFIFLYQRYHRAFVVLEVSELLAASWQRLLAFVVEYGILDEVFVRKVYDHVAQIVGSA